MNQAFRGYNMNSPRFLRTSAVELAPREEIGFECANGHTFFIMFALEANFPTDWDCPRCGAASKRTDGTVGEVKQPRKTRRHWDMLRERRSIAELEALLAERLAEVRKERG
ncbi:MAG: RNA polymerase-binding protein RbpA [Propionibacteriaceae bacterium]|jgi:hypothetical protein|nr:RNA polymerase-binding protein RbpA [Propionibacteriaceae bacterium]